MGTCHAMGGHRSLVMIMVWAWVQIQRKMLGSGSLISVSMAGHEWTRQEIWKLDCGYQVKYG